MLAFMRRERCKWWIDENDQLRVGWLIVAVLVVVVLVAYVFACGVAQSLDEQRDHWWLELWAYRFAQEGAWFDVARTTATLVAIPGAAVALVIAFARHRISQQQVAVSQQQVAVGQKRVAHAAPSSASTSLVETAPGGCTSSPTLTRGKTKKVRWSSSVVAPPLRSIIDLM